MGLAFYKLAKRLFGAKLRVCNAFTGSLQNPCKNVPYGPNYEYHGSYVAGEDQWKWAVEGYKVVGDAVAKLDLQLAYETHMGYLHDMPEPVKKLVDLIGRPSIGVNLDYGNIIYLKNAPSLKDTIEGLGKRIFYCHLKNSAPLPTGGRLPTSLADGEINHREYLALLKKIRFDGPIGIEAPRPGDREWFAKQDLAYIRSVMADVG
jgi:sugar phosphate isomerase/epimerase